MRVPHLVPKEVKPKEYRLVAISVALGLGIGGAQLATGADTDTATAIAFISSLQVAVGVWLGVRVWFALVWVESRWIKRLDLRLDEIRRLMDDRGISSVEPSERRKAGPSVLTKLSLKFADFFPWFTVSVITSAVAIFMDTRVDVIDTDIQLYILVAASVATCVAVLLLLLTFLRIEWRTGRMERLLRNPDAAPTGYQSVGIEDRVLPRTTNVLIVLAFAMVGIKTTDCHQPAGIAT